MGVIRAVRRRNESGVQGLLPVGKCDKSIPRGRMERRSTCANAQHVHREGPDVPCFLLQETS